MQHQHSNARLTFLALSMALGVTSIDALAVPPPPPSSGTAQTSPPPPSTGTAQTPPPPSTGTAQTPPPPSSGTAQTPPPPPSSGTAQTPPPPPSTGTAQTPPPLPSSGTAQTPPPPPSTGTAQTPPPPPSTGTAQTPPPPPSSGTAQTPPPPPSSGTAPPPPTTDTTQTLPPLAFRNPSGVAQTYSIDGPIDRNNPFFQSLGSNGRSCESCHSATDGWSVNPPTVQALFTQTQGLAPIFRVNDGATSPNADVSTAQARQTAYRLLLDKGLIRVGLGIPANAEFELAAVDDPYRYASAAELSLFRRPLPATNLAFLSSVMWDGRENLDGQSIAASLANQANDATLGHAQALQPLTPEQRQQIVAFETSLYTAQISDNQAGGLDLDGALGGPVPLASQIFYPGINDPRGNDPTGAAFNPAIFNVYDAWLNGGSTNTSTAQQNAKASIARGQRLFNSRTFAVREAAGVNVAPNVQPVALTCGSCHNTPNAGSQSVRAFVNIGIANPPVRVPELPLYTLRNLATGATTQTSDPGRALISGRWQDIGRFKVPTLRGLAARAPYFHNGSAPTTEAVVGFYNRRFNIGLTPGEQADLANFLKSL